MSIKRIKEIIEENKTFLITSHINSEGDSIGSQLAFYELLKNLGKNAFILNEHKPPSLYKFLPYIEEIGTDLSKKPPYDVAIILDCPVLERTGKALALLDRQRPIVNIDHHISNNYFGDINWVDENASSCGEMVYELYRAFERHIDKEVALLLYVAILTDTGSFGYENTSARTHLIAKELIEKGLNPVDVHNRIYESKSFSEIALLRNVLTTLEVIHDGKIAYLYVTRKMMLESGCEASVTDGFINYARSIEGTKVALLFLEDPHQADKIQVSFRGKGEINVNELASYFNGGGHRNAAGCVMQGELKEVMDKVLEVVKKEV